MNIAVGIAAAIALGTLNGILIAEAMYGRWPIQAIDDGIEWIARRSSQGEFPR